MFTATNPVNLFAKYSQKPQLLREISQARETGKEKFSAENTALDLKAGDIVIFLSGHDGNTPMMAQIWGFDLNGWALMVWDCYWSPVNLYATLVHKCTNIAQYPTPL